MPNRYSLLSPISPHNMPLQNLTHQNCVFGQERRIQLRPIVQQMISAPFVALLNQWLQFQHHLRFNLIVLLQIFLPQMAIP